MVQPEDVPAATGEWECMECGYVEEGTQTRRPKECPECGAPATAFEFFALDEDEDDDWDDEDDKEDDDDILLDDDEDADEDDY